MSPKQAEFQYEVPPDAKRLDHFLSQASGKSRTFVQEQIAQGRVLINAKKARKPGEKLRPGDLVTGSFVEEADLGLIPVSANLSILYEDDRLLIVNKEQGCVVHPAAGHRGETLVHYLLHHLKNHSPFSESHDSRPGIIHRLDVGTSGVIAVGKDRETVEKMSAAFKAREVKKEYRALVWGKQPASGQATTPIGRDRSNRKKMSSKTEKAREAVTQWQRLEGLGILSYLAIFPRTGRTHQIRVHLSESKAPIVNDSLYGGTLTPQRILQLPESLRPHAPNTKFPFLHAYKLSFRHPWEEKDLEITAPLAPLFETWLEILRKENAAH